jgi:hypothetical protein
VQTGRRVFLRELLRKLEIKGIALYFIRLITSFMGGFKKESSKLFSGAGSKTFFLFKLPIKLPCFLHSDSLFNKHVENIFLVLFTGIYEAYFWHMY